MLDVQFEEQQWPAPHLDVSHFTETTVRILINSLMNCLGAADLFTMTLRNLKRSLIPTHPFIICKFDVPFNFSCGIDILSRNRILIDKLTVLPDIFIVIYQHQCDNLNDCSRI